jgi:hypothetical protein
MQTALVRELMIKAAEVKADPRPADTVRTVALPGNLCLLPGLRLADVVRGRPLGAQLSLGGGP